MASVDLFDTHFHVRPEDDLQSLLAEARRAGVSRLVVVAGSLGEARRLHERLPPAAPDVWVTAGVHPHVASQFEGDLEPFRELARRPGTVAVGEIGLDYHYDHCPREDQVRAFRAFLRLSAEEGLPAVVHCRDAYDDCLAILEEELVPGQRFEIHCFTGSPSWARDVLDLGAYVSFNGILTFKKADNVRAALAVVPEDRLLVETDAPFLAPVPYRGKPNRPAYLVEIVRRVACERGWGFEEAAALTMANANRFFGLEV